MMSVTSYWLLERDCTHTDTLVPVRRYILALITKLGNNTGIVAQHAVS
jgi:hypothetical protein